MERNEVARGQAAWWQYAALVLVSECLSIASAIMYAVSKKYSPWLGILGTFLLGGLLVLRILPDRYETGR